MRKRNDNSDLQLVYLSENSTGIFKNRTMMLGDLNYTYLLDISHLNYGNIVKFSFHAKDKAGNMGLRDNGGLNYSIQIQDSYEPITSIDINFIREPFYISFATNITLFANDSAILGGSGVSQIRYKIDNGEWKDYVGPFNLSEYSQGFHIIYYNSTDFAGNIENTNQIKVYLTAEVSQSDDEDETSIDEIQPSSISLGLWSLIFGSIAAIIVVNHMKSKYSL